jgi:peptidoglycan/xylan/chitin deacetylase (PgdA/CDA1 family)/uncharacterized lipoprotein YddW (UPF0748 family)
MNSKRNIPLSRLTQAGSVLIALTAIAVLALRDGLSDTEGAGESAAAGQPATRPIASHQRRSAVETPDTSAIHQPHGPARGLRVVVRSARNLTDPAAIDAFVERLAESGVSDVWVQCKQDDSDEFPGGVAFYPSTIAPVAPGFEDDRLGRFIESLERRHIRTFAWVPAMNDASAAEAHPSWRAWTAHEDGTRTEQAAWLCPRNPEVVAYEASILAEIAARYPTLAGAYTDFIRYDSDHSCVCDRCLGELAATIAGSGKPKPLTPVDIISAGNRRTSLWQAWTTFRAASICAAVDSMRDAIDESREGMWFGASVLPFSAQDYAFNTQSGQDLYEMARVGLDEIVLMGYWDDWGKRPQWLTECVASAADLLEDECTLSCLLDGDMSVSRTCRTLQAVEAMPLDRIGFFHYGQWTDRELRRIRGAVAATSAGSVPVPEFTAVTIRIDTEPDYTGSYEAVHPEMIDRLVDLFDAEGIQATFVTCGRLAELEPAPLRRAAARGHEIACHAYDHEQIDSLEADAQIAVTDRGLKALKDAGLDVVGFGAPRNSITESVRDHLIDVGLAYDGSLAYDPMQGYADTEIHLHPNDPSRSILMIPFIVPNDWDALRLMKVTPEAMLALWLERLDQVCSTGEPVFVLDIHQWLASGDEELSVLRSFIRAAKGRSDCRMMPLREAATHARNHILLVERDANEAILRESGAVRAEVLP